MKNLGIILLSALFVIIQTADISCISKKSPGENSKIDSSLETSSTDTIKINTANGVADFVSASKAAMPAIVHIKFTTIHRRLMEDQVQE